VLLSACAQVSVAGNSMGQATGAVEVCSREDPRGANTKIRKSTLASLTRATETGNCGKVMASTTTFSAGKRTLLPAQIPCSRRKPKDLARVEPRNSCTRRAEPPAAAPNRVFR
jgi:hypothetical protein